MPYTSKAARLGRFGDANGRSSIAFTHAARNSLLPKPVKEVISLRNRQQAGGCRKNVFSLQFSCESALSSVRPPRPKAKVKDAPNPKLSDGPVVSYDRYVMGL
jgi:hypothetical protein